MVVKLHYTSQCTERSVEEHSALSIISGSKALEGSMTYISTVLVREFAV